MCTKLFKQCVGPSICDKYLEIGSSSKTMVGAGKSRVQQIVIHYRFVGCIEILDAPQIVHAFDTRQGVRVSYEVIAV